MVGMWPPKNLEPHANLQGEMSSVNIGSGGNVMSKLFRLARPQFLIASLALFITGTCWAIILGAAPSLPRILLGYLIILSAHLSIAFSNDYFDVEVDKLGVPAFLSGGSGILVKHSELRKPARRIALALICCSLILAVLFLRIYSYRLWFLGFVALCNLLGWFYAAPPLRLVYRGLGELSSALIMGCLVPLMGYLVTRGFLDGYGFLFTIPLILYALASLVAVSIPDEVADRLGHKHTWVTIRSAAFGFTAIGLLFLLCTGFYFALPYFSSHALPIDFRLLSFASLLPLGAGVYGITKRHANRAAAARSVNRIILMLGVFFVLMDGYLLYLVI